MRFLLSRFVKILSLLRWTSVLAMAFFLVGCSTSRVSSTTRISETLPSNKIAVAPGSVLADAVGVELFQYGYDVVPASMVDVVVGKKYWISNSDFLTPQNMSKLRAKGIGSLLVIRSSSEYGGVPQAAVVRLIDTSNLETLAAVNWQGDSTLSSELVKAAAQIASELRKGFPH